MIYVYKCECGNIQEENHSYKEVTNDEHDFKHNLLCQSCHQIGKMERVVSGGSGFSKLSAASIEGKREMLQKRSKDHFQKNIKEKFHYLNRKDVMP